MIKGVKSVRRQHGKQGKHNTSSSGMGAGTASTTVRALVSMSLAAVLAASIFLYANRLIAAQFAQRADLEIRTYFILWLACLVHAAVRRPARPWRC